MKNNIKFKYTFKNDIFGDEIFYTLTEKEIKKDI